jgi:two-component system phosphate regulon sensor histidine kinase PhoR
MRRLNPKWKLYLIYTALLITGVTLVGFVVEDHLERKLKTHLKEDLLLMARVIGKALPQSEHPKTLDDFCKDYRQIAGVRITVMKKDGRVIGESERISEGALNYADRPEVQGALAKGAETSIRYSPTMQTDLLFAAVLLEGKIIRLAMPMTKVQAFENEVMIFFSLILFFTPVLALVIAFIFTKYRFFRAGDQK